MVRHFPQQDIFTPTGFLVSEKNCHLNALRSLIKK